MSIPRRSRSRMADSVLQAGPMVQMILARRKPLGGVGFSSVVLCEFVFNRFLDDRLGLRG